MKAQVAHELARHRSPVRWLILPVTLAIWSEFTLLAVAVTDGRAAFASLMAGLGYLSAALTQSVGMAIIDRSADRQAAAVVGAGRLADALERLQRSGQMCPPGFSLWLCITPGQPQLPQRLARLRAVAAAGAGPDER